MFVVLSGDCARAGLRATLSPSLPTSLSPCRVGSGGRLIKLALGREGASQEFVTFQVGEAQTGQASSAAIRMPFGSRIRNWDSPAAAGNTVVLSSSRVRRCRHSQSRKASGAASSWRAASATS